ncbi:hypothetical protein JFT64_06485 [Pseudomonas carnis]|uniref:hypothetical protein n=1 Tax=Pseudomonas carnis TaxID=2487355 RepID=UPI0018E88653|nr:hypothetical protein [Pseudomonas carnis]MBJ2211692.1 hypothetical protein [Pseudomonas carnis]
MRNIKKSDTFTPSEKMLAKLGDKAFLSLWSFANVYTDEGLKISDKGERKGQGEELCDLLVVFGDHVLIFSDKGQIEYRPKDDVKISWRRWIERAFLKSAHSTYKAEKWIKELPHRIFLDKECTEKFPIAIPSKDVIKVHRIAVARGITEHAKKFYKDESGTLIIKPDIVGNEHFKNPFMIGVADKKKGYVHFFDEDSIDIVFNELDTLKDFTDYLTKKEELINSEMLLVAPGEDELLGYYLSSREKEEYMHSPQFIMPEGRTNEVIAVQQGFYSGHKHTQEYKTLKEIGRISYFWDSSIEIMGSAAFTGRWHETNGKNYDEEITVLKYMASESRMARSILSDAFSEVSRKPFPASEIKPRVRVSGSPTNLEMVYVWLVMQFSSEQKDYAEYREQRKALITSYCMACKDAFPQFKTIVGIASDAVNNKGASEELVYIHTDDWTDEEYKHAKWLREELGLLKNLKSVMTEIPSKNKESELAKLRKRKKKTNKEQKASRRKSR